LLIVGLTALRFVTAAYLPLSFDEAYFWLWSRKLALSYFEHPPLIALAIRGGTTLFGDTSFGVRFVPLLASVVASWAVWRSAALLCNRRIAWTACAFFNLTLMVASQGMGATPDALVLAASALMLLSVIQLEQTGQRRRWLAAALALGLALLSKYTAFFLGLSVCLWVVASPAGRSWLRTPWPYLAAGLAILFLAPNLIWNETHGWITFRYQFGRIVAGHQTARHFPEFILGQIALCSPGILALAAIGFARHVRTVLKRDRFTILLAVIVPALVYFSFHSLHDRVQGNWPSFIYPAIAILAAATIHERNDGSRTIRWLNNLAIPVASVILAFSYAQTWTGALPLGKSDPVARMTAMGFAPVAEELAERARADGAAALVTTRYVNTGWLAFYVRPHLPVLQAAEEYRWSDAPAAAASMLDKPLLYVTQNPARELRFITPLFAKIRFEGCVARRRGGVVIDSFCLYRLEGFRHRAGGTRIPVAYMPKLG
jgi:4-amino-4-deoxy-L-arabinose transferase-like glycosyltransferase